MGCDVNVVGWKSTMLRNGWMDWCTISLSFVLAASVLVESM